VSPGPWSDAAAARFSRAERIRLQPAERASGTADIDAKLMRPIARSRYALPFRGPHDAIGPADDDRPAQQTGRGGCGRGGARHQGEEGDEPPSRHADRDRWDPGMVMHGGAPVALSMFGFIVARSGDRTGNMPDMNINENGSGSIDTTPGSGRRRTSLSTPVPVRRDVRWPANYAGCGRSGGHCARSGMAVVCEASDMAAPLVFLRYYFTNARIEAM